MVMHGVRSGIKTQTRGYKSMQLLLSKRTVTKVIKTCKKIIMTVETNQVNEKGHESNDEKVVSENHHEIELKVENQVDNESLQGNETREILEGEIKKCEMMFDSLLQKRLMNL